MIKSQDELNTCNDGKRKSDVLIATIEKLEKTEEKLKIAKNCMNSAAQFLTCMDDLSELYEKSNEQLALEVLNKGLEELRNDKI